MFETKAEKAQMRQIKEQIAENQKIFIETFKTNSGELVLDNLKRRCFENVTTFDDNPHRMAFNEGRRSVLKYIDGIINKDIQAIMEELTNG